jgi:hypothetical protein
MIIGMCILVQFYNNNRYVTSRNNINKLKYIDAKKKLRMTQHNVQRNVQHNMPHNVHHNIPHSVQHNMQHNMPHSVQHNMQHNMPHDVQHNMPHDVQHNMPHDVQHNMPHDVQHNMPHDVQHHHNMPYNIDSFENSMKEFDFRNVRDVFVPPIKRPSESVVMPVITNPQYNIYTRGYPGKYSWMGILINIAEPGDNASFSQDNKIIKLFGRQQYPGSTQYKYYVTINTGNDQTKINLDKDIYKRELYDDDIVIINELGMSFKVKMNDSNWLEYSPYVI